MRIYVTSVFVDDHDLPSRARGRARRLLQILKHSKRWRAHVQSMHESIVESMPGFSLSRPLARMIRPRA